MPQRRRRSEPFQCPSSLRLVSVIGRSQPLDQPLVLCHCVSLCVCAIVCLRACCLYYSRLIAGPSSTTLVVVFFASSSPQAPPNAAPLEALVLSFSRSLVWCALSYKHVTTSMHTTVSNHEGAQAHQGYDRAIHRHVSTQVCFVHHCASCKPILSFVPARRDLSGCIHRL
jgi:hypothetical protein